MTGRTLALAAALVGAAGAVTIAVWRPGAAPRVIVWQGVAVRWAGERGIALGPEGALLRFRPGPVVEAVPLDPAGRAPLEAAVDAAGTVWLVDGAGSVLRLRDDGSLEAVGRTPFDVPTLAAGPEGLWAARSPVQFTFRPETAGVALAVRLDAAPDGWTPSVTAGEARIPDNPFLAQLANASRILALRDGGVVVAPFVRDLVARFDADGQERWSAGRGLTHETPNPTLLVRDDPGGPRVLADYAPVNLALAEGPDGTLYALSTVAARTDSARLDALDPASGRVRRTWRFGTALPTLVADGRGEVRLVESDSLAPGLAGERREPFPPFALPTPGGDTLRLADLEGRVVLVNFWASWCGPCRDEFPALDSLAARFDSSSVRFAGLSEDVSRGAARRFLEEYPVRHIAIAYGDGALKDRYHYVGLPFTALLDARGRVIRRWIGFTGHGQIGQIAALIHEELRRTGGALATPEHRH